MPLYLIQFLHDLLFIIAKILCNRCEFSFQIGIFILRMMRNGLVMIGVPGLASHLFLGAIILGMMALHSGLERRRQAGA